MLWLISTSVCLVHHNFITSIRRIPSARMLAVLCSSPRPPLGVALLGLFITAISSTLHLLPYIIFCIIIVLSIWVPSRPAYPKVVYYPVDGYSQHVHAVYTSDATPPADEKGSFELNACLGVLLFLLSIPVASILENLLIRPTRDIFLQTVEHWFDMRYVQPLLATGSWPDTWTPLLNAFRSFPFVANFIDGVIGNDNSPKLTRKKKVRWASLQPSTPGRDSGGCSGISSRTRSAVRKTSSSYRAAHRKGQRELDRKHTSSLDTVVEHSSNDPLPRETFISPPRALPSPISKDLSRTSGVRHPSRFKPVPRRQSYIITRVLSASATNINFKRTSFSATLTPIPPSKDCDSVISCPNVVKIPEQVEQIQSAQSSDDVLPLVPRRSEPEILMRPWTSVSASQGQRSIQSQYTQFPVLHAAPRQEQHIPVYEPRLTVPALSNAPEVSMDCPQPLLDSVTFQQQQLPEAMDIDLNCPQSLMHRLQQYPSSMTESALPTCPQLHPLQNQFTNASQSQFTNAVSGFSSSGRSFSDDSPMLQCTWAPHFQEESSLPSPQEQFPVDSCAPEWTSSSPPSATMTDASQAHIIQPLQDVNATETFALNVHPDTATPYFDFSLPPAPASPTRSNHDLSQPVDKNVHQPEVLPASSSGHQPEVVPRPSSPVDTVKAKADDKHDDGSSSDSDTSDSDYMESSDSDSDDDSSSSEDDEEDTSAPIAGPSKIDKGKGKAP